MNERRVPCFAARVSPPGPGAIHLLWLGGEGAEGVLRALAGSRATRGATHLQWGKLALRGESIDEAMWRQLAPEESLLPGPVFEISIHGSPAVLDAALDAMASLGAQILDHSRWIALAQEQAGADRLRLESWAALLEAGSEAGARLFLAQAQGALSREIRALLDAAGGSGRSVDLPSRLALLLDRGRAAAALRSARTVALCGRPNAGKSTLFNALVGYERAIVSPQEGTTRDPIEEIVLVGGYPVRLLDTAGLRQSEDPIEREGARLAREAARRADLAVLVWDGRAPWGGGEQEALDALPREKTIAFPFRDGPIAQSVARWEIAVLKALQLPFPAPTEGPCPVSPRQVEAIARAKLALESGGDPAPALRDLISP